MVSAAARMVWMTMSISVPKVFSLMPKSLLPPTFRAARCINVLAARRWVPAIMTGADAMQRREIRLCIDSTQRNMIQFSLTHRFWVRLNASDGSFGVLYVAQKPSGAFAENVSANAGPNTDRCRFSSPQGLRSPGASLRSNAHQIGWSRLGDPRRNCEVVHGGLPYDVPQAWSKALFDHPVGAHGIAYHARHDDEALCYAIFDRARSAIKEVERETDLDKNWFWRLAQEYKVGMAPN